MPTLPSAWILHQFAENNHFFHLNSLYIMYPLQSVRYRTSIQYEPQLNKKQEFGRRGGGQINYFFEILDKLITWKEQNLAKFTILAKFSKVKSTIFHPS